MEEINKEQQANIKFAKNRLIPQFHKMCEIGSYEVEDFDPITNKGDIVKITADSEYYFYKLFIKLMGIQIEYQQELFQRGNNANYQFTISEPSQPLIKGDVEYLALFLCKPLDYTLTFSTRKNEFEVLGSALGKTATSAKNAFVRIRELNYIYKTDDQIWEPCRELQYLRKKIKTGIEKDGFVLFSYIFNCVIE